MGNSKLLTAYFMGIEHAPITDQELLGRYPANEIPGEYGSVEERIVLHKIKDLVGKLDSHDNDVKFKEIARELAEELSVLLENKKGIAHKALRVIQKHWNRLSTTAQWAILKGEAITPMPIHFANALMKMGLIRYKGHESIVDRDADIKHQAAWDKKKAIVALEIGGLFDKKIAALAPFIEPLGKITDKKDEVLAVIRAHMDELSIGNEIRGKEKIVMNREDVSQSQDNTSARMAS